MAIAHCASEALKKAKKRSDIVNQLLFKDIESSFRT